MSLLEKIKVNKLLDMFKPKKLFSNLSHLQQKQYIEKERISLYYVYSSSLLENYINGLMAYDDYAEQLYSEDDFLDFCYLFLEDEKVII